MNGAAWAAVAAAIAGLAGTGAGVLWRGGRREGITQQLLQELVATDQRLVRLIEDLDDRLRVLEHRPARRRHG